MMENGDAGKAKPSTTEKLFVRRRRRRENAISALSNDARWSIGDFNRDFASGWLHISIRSSKKNYYDLSPDGLEIFIKFQIYRRQSIFCKVRFRDLKCLFFEVSFRVMEKFSEVISFFLCNAKP